MDSTSNRSSVRLCFVSRRKVAKCKLSRISLVELFDSCPPGAAAAAEKFWISARTVEAWRSCKAPLPIKAAYAIAEIIAGLDG